MAKAVTSTTRRRLSRADRAQQLLAVAEAVFAERGIRAVSMDEIAERAGVTKPLLYDHFGSKDGLVAAVVEQAGQVLADTVLAAVAEAPDAETALACGLRAYFGFIDDRRSAWHALLADAATPGSQAGAALDRIRDRQAELIAGLLQPEAPAASGETARLYAEIIVGATERLAARIEPPVGSVDNLTRHVMDVIWQGLDAVRAGRRWDSSN
ncbi:MAG TPA: helix-turn-helix domain-containing protein [Mycobacteriales bacterium]|nr:helix-turn-helix domain-containing protein [Mycobacteriales bacterium]